MIKKTHPVSQVKIALSKAPYTIEEEITPEKAEAYLAKMPANRSLRQDHVEMLARDMKAGKWVLSNDSLAFNKKGEFIDGQHRLKAVIFSGVTVPMFVTYNLSEEAADTIDRNIPRTHGDMLTLNHQIPRGRRVAAVARMLWFLEQDEVDFSMHTKTSVADIIDVTQRWRSEIEWGLDHVPPRVEPGIPSGGAPTIAAFVFMRALAPSRIDRLAERFVKGEGDGPVRAMRAVLVRDSAKTNRHPLHMLELMLRGIEAYLAGERLTRLLPNGVIERARLARADYEQGVSRPKAANDG